MRENCLYGSEGTGITGPSYPYQAGRGGSPLPRLSVFHFRERFERCHPERSEGSRMITAIWNRHTGDASLRSA